MDSERFSILHKESNIAFQPLPPDELTAVAHHVELARHLQEIRQLYQIVLFNLRAMRDNYEWMNSGEVRYKGQPAEGREHFIAVNALVINLIGSAKTLTDSMECYMKQDEPKGSAASQSYFDFLHQIYDHCFAYRFLIRLRDFSQHGHPPVSQQCANYCFDLRQITEMPHFSHNQKIKAQMDAAVREILTVYRDLPTLGVTMTVAEFTVGLLQIYDRFLTCAEAHLRASFAQFRAILAAHPEKVNQLEDSPVLFVYDVQDRYAHTVLTEDDTTEMLESYQKEAKETLQIFQHDWNQLKEATLFVNHSSEKKEISIL